MSYSPYSSSGDGNVLTKDGDINNDPGSSPMPTADGGIVSGLPIGDVLTPPPELKGSITTEIEVHEISTPSSDTSSFDSQDQLDYGLPPSLPDNYQVVLNHDPRLSFNFVDEPRSIPDLTQEKMHKIPGIMRMYYDYQRAYSGQATNAEHVERARVLAVTLLEHFFPASQLFKVEEIPAFPTVGPGWSIQLKRPSNEALDFHFIAAEKIVCFMVSKVYDMTAEDGTHSEQSFPHTYLTVLVDDLTTINQWRPDNGASGTNTRGDIMAYSMGVRAKIQTGYGIVILGPRIEFYRYDNDDNKPMQRLQKDNWAFDMRTESPAMVSQTFEFVASKTVLYQNGVLGTGSRRVMAKATGLPTSRA